MGLLQKKPQVSTSVPLYRSGPVNNVLIVGLGNLGKQYEGTRHNIGFACVDDFAAKLEFPKWIEKKDLGCAITRQDVSDSRVILIKPMTFMNLSGKAVQAVARFYKIPDRQILAVYDELDMPYGQIRTRMGGTSAGHNGVKSLIQHLGENFGRVRIGINGPSKGKRDDKDYVLAKFTKDEAAELAALYQEVNSILSEYIYRGELLPETRSFIL